MKILFVFNHRSGKGISDRLLGETVEYLLREGHRVRYIPAFEFSKGGEELRQELAGYDRILCYGGDGTLSRLVGKLHSLDVLQNCDIGYIPGGSTNDFACSLGIPAAKAEALQTAVGEQKQQVDIGLFNGNPFVYVAAFGLFTDVSYNTDQNLKNVLGHSAYILSGAKSLFSVKPHHLRLTVDEKTVEGDFILGLISNSKQVGGFKGLFDATLTDGMFEVTLVKSIHDFADVQDMLEAVGEIGLGKLEQHRSIVHLTGKHIEIESEDDVEWTLDGEYGGVHRTADIRVLQNQLTVCL